ncbi:bifunctional DNA primase/polymerase [Bifidobacterium sp. SO4]|uniref:bifunctional DNA primase/polymerase n=1 Tax=Bifidobacterium sp. SO4 TaxID=2809030 RepID=UPI001BDD5583|nr:bifunctional DNA primase/polymerase [Bifidobacterium sp. SO4]MBT1171003.1 bifunctional DNA primase/polymerase [Bifidobacterium sp. SO4]
MTDSIFGSWWYPYYNAGWHQLTLLPHHGKRPPEERFTGYSQVPHDEIDYDRRAAMEKYLGYSMNFGLVMPAEVICLDVDSPDGHTRKEDGAPALAAKERELGALPPTWTSGHGNPGSPYRHRFFRVPPDIPLHAICEGVDLIRRTHRFVVAPPSIHPSGEVYYWLRPDGSRADPGEIPSPNDFPMLPPAWIEAMRNPVTDTGPEKDRKPTSGPATAAASGPVFTPTRRSLGRTCRACATVVKKWEKNPTYGDQSCRHDGTLKAVRTLAFLDAGGHVGAVAAAKEIIAEYPRVISDRASSDEATAEARSMYRWAWEHVPEHAGILVDPCLTWRFRNSLNPDWDEVLATAETEAASDMPHRPVRPALDGRTANLARAGLDDYDAILLANIIRHGRPAPVPVSAGLREIWEHGGEMAAGRISRLHKRLEEIRQGKDLESVIG